jgi:NAD(P)-dependent dehydrogenase (short-subunit alcohol dehydrogenase family)
LEIKPEEWAQVLAVNLTSVFSCLQAEIAQMIQQESGGSIVNTASICGLVALPHASAYNAAKHGIVGLTKSSALEYGPQNVRVNAVCPGFIDTPMLAKGAGANAQVLEGGGAHNTHATSSRSQRSGRRGGLAVICSVELR